jgi:hypothetical protein
LFRKHAAGASPADKTARKGNIFRRSHFMALGLSKKKPQNTNTTRPRTLADMDKWQEYQATRQRLLDQQAQLEDELRSIKANPPPDQTGEIIEAAAAGRPLPDDATDKRLDAVHRVERQIAAVHAALQRHDQAGAMLRTNLAQEIFADYSDEYFAKLAKVAKSIIAAKEAKDELDVYAQRLAMIGATVNPQYLPGINFSSAPQVQAALAPDHFTPIGFRRDNRNLLQS